MSRNRLVAAAVVLAMAAGLLSGVVDAGAVRIGRPDAPGGAATRQLELENSPVAALQQVKGMAASPAAVVDAPFQSTDLVASTDRAVWLPTDDVNDMAIDPATGRVYLSMQDEVRIYDANGSEIGVIGGLLAPMGLAVSGGILYVAEQGRPAISQFDTTSRALVRRFTVPLAAPGAPGVVGVAVAGGRLWYLASGKGIVGLDPVTGVQLGAYAFTVTGLDPGTNDRFLRAVPGNPNRLVTGSDIIGTDFTKVFDVTTNTPVAVPIACALDVNTNWPVGPPAFTDGTHLLTANHGLEVRTLDGRCQTHQVVQPVAGVAAATPERGGLMAAAGDAISVFRQSDDALVRTYTLSGDGFPTVRRLLAFSPDGGSLYAVVHRIPGVSAPAWTKLLVLHPFDAPGAPSEPAAPNPPTLAPDYIQAAPYSGTRDIVVHEATGRVAVSMDSGVTVFERSGQTAGAIAGVASPWGLADGGASMWVVDRSVNRVVRFDPATLTVQGSWSLAPLSNPAGLTFRAGTLWAIDDTGHVLGVSAATGAVVGSLTTVGDEIDTVPALPGRLLTSTVFNGNLAGSALIDVTAAPVAVTQACGPNFAQTLLVPFGEGYASRGGTGAVSIASLPDACATGRRYPVGSAPFGLGASSGAQPVLAVAIEQSPEEVLFFHAGDALPFHRVAVPPSVLGFSTSTIAPRVALSADGSHAYVVYLVSAGLSTPARGLVVTVQLANVGMPTVTSIDPKLVTTDGGTITVHGTNLLGATALIDGVTPASVDVRSASQIVVAVPPSLAIGQHSFVVHTSSGDTTPDSPTGFTVVRALRALGEYTPVTPTRLLDTRDGTGQPAAGVVGPGESIELTVLGAGGVPAAGVAAVVLNVTVTDPGSAGYLTVYPTGGAVPLASNLNFVAGQTVPNLVTVRVGAGGKVSFYNSSVFTHVIADLAGYFSSLDGPRGTRFYPITPVRVIDTRGSAPLGTAEEGYIDLLAGDPDEAADRAHIKGWVLNVTATEGTKSTFVTVWPRGFDRPLASNLNVVKGQTVPNLVMTPANEGGFVSFYNHAGSVHIVADVVGILDDRPVGEAGRFIPLDGPTRLLDTRDTTPLVDGETRVLDLASAPALPGPDFVSGVIANVTATGPTADTFVTVYPSGRDLPVASNLNVVAGQTVPNLVVARTGADGGMALYNLRGRTDLVVDVVGWLTSVVGDFAFD